MNASVNRTLSVICFVLAFLALVGLALVWWGGSVPGALVGILIFLGLVNLGIVLFRRS